jgi:PilZ domain-containing protein
MTVQNLGELRSRAGSLAPQRGTQAAQPRGGSNRRRYRRISAPILCRPAGAEFFAPHLEPIDIGFGGVRIHSHEEYRVGEGLPLDIFVRGMAPVMFTTEIVWIESWGSGSRACFDLGLAFIDLNSDARTLLSSVVTPEMDLIGYEETEVPSAAALSDTSFACALDEPVVEVGRTIRESAVVPKGRDSCSVLSRTPIVVADDAELRAVRLDGHSCFLVSLIDGVTSVESLIELSGMSAEDLLTTLEELRLRQIVELC